MLSQQAGLRHLVPESRLKGEESTAWAQQVTCGSLELALALRQLATLVCSGVHIVDSLRVLTQQSDNPNMVEVWWTVGQTVESGYPLSRALERFPGIFNRLVTTLIRIGESSGSLPLCLEQIAVWLERDYGFATTLRSRLTYPAFVLAFAGLLTAWLFTVVLPPFLEVTQTTGAPLPWPTRVVFGLISSLSSPGGVLLGLAVVLGLLRFVQWAKQPEGRRQLLGWGHQLYGVSSFLTYSANLRAALAASILLKAGCDVLTTWKLALMACDDPILEERYPTLLRCIKEGEQPSAYFARHPEVFLPVFAQMVQGGEETGRLPRFLEGLCRLFQEELDHRVKLILGLLEPLVMVVLSAIMLLVLLAVFLPLYSHLNNLGL